MHEEDRLAQAIEQLTAVLVRGIALIHEAMIEEAAWRASLDEKRAEVHEDHVG